MRWRVTLRKEEGKDGDNKPIYSFKTRTVRGPADERSALMKADATHTQRDRKTGKEIEHTTKWKPLVAVIF